MARAYIALGSNLRDPAQEVSLAISELDSLPQTRLVQASSLYRTTPVGYDNQPDFINAVAEVDTSLEPIDLLRAILELENLHGRERPFPNAPRVLDLDLLLYEQAALETPELTLPHPRMHQRGFVLLPLAEIAPDTSIGTHGNAAVLAAQCADQGVTLWQGVNI